MRTDRCWASAKSELSSLKSELGRILVAATLRRALSASPMALQTADEENLLSARFFPQRFTKANRNESLRVAGWRDFVRPMTDGATVGLPTAVEVG
jgi:hypothetical protein